jgi:hypothetical protein
MNQRPCGITVLGLFYLFLGGISILWSLFATGIASVSWLTGSLFGMPLIGSGGGVWQGVLGIAAAVVQILAGIGLLGLKPWGWLLAVIGVGLTVLQGVIGMFGGGLMGFCCGGLGILLPLGVLFYLLTPRIRSAFR